MYIEQYCYSKTICKNVLVFYFTCNHLQKCFANVLCSRRRCRRRCCCCRCCCCRRRRRCCCCCCCAEENRELIFTLFFIFIYFIFVFYYYLLFFLFFFHFYHATLCTLSGIATVSHPSVCPILLDFSDDNDQHPAPGFPDPHHHPIHIYYCDSYWQPRRKHENSQQRFELSQCFLAAN